MMDAYPDGYEFPTIDGRVPLAIRKLGACTVSVGKNQVYVYIGGHCGEGYFIYREPHPEPPIGSDCWKITDQLWYYEGA